MEQKSVHPTEATSEQPHVSSKANQIVPLGPTLKALAEDAPSSHSQLVRPPRATFAETYGRLGLLMVAVLLICVAWTAFLVVLTLAPTATANTLMNTADLDGGRFWLIVDADDTIKYTSVISLLILEAYYLSVLGTLITRQRMTTGICKTIERQLTKRQFTEPRWRQRLVRFYLYAYASWREMTSYRGKNRRLWVRLRHNCTFIRTIDTNVAAGQNIVLKSVDLTVQCAQLSEILDNGSPATLVRSYTIFLCCNALSVACGIMFSLHSAMTEVVVDSM